MAVSHWRFLIRKFLIKKMSCIGSTRGATPYRSWVQMCRPGLWVYTPLPPGVWVRILNIFSFPRSMGMIYPNLSYFPYFYSRCPYLLLCSFRCLLFPVFQYPKICEAAFPSLPFHYDSEGVTPYGSWVQMCRPGLWVHTPSSVRCMGTYFEHLFFPGLWV